MKKCGYCGRENPDQATHCNGCVTEFEPAQDSSRQAVVASTSQHSDRTVAQKNMLHGALWCGGGILVTAITYSAASSGGGTYIVAWGAILFGAIQFFKGLANRDEKSHVEDDGYEVLAAATSLETQGRIQEATEAYQKIVEAFPGKPVGRDAQISLDALRNRAV